LVGFGFSHKGIKMTTAEIIKALNSTVELLPTASTIQLAVLMTQAAMRLEALEEETRGAF
jgi:hypothetical protein